ncbi:MAG TPA: DUF4845 domain-containing protein [Gammaproteobacteria bacterium]|nr:DUF4845 domain-containing protein [Gammaproteobacteria bacterium]
MADGNIRCRVEMSSMSAMYSLNRQRGVSFIFALPCCAIAGFVFTVGLKLIPIYMNAYTIYTILKEVAAEARSTDTDPSQILSSIEKRLDINDIGNIMKGNSAYHKDHSNATIPIKYEARTQLVGNLQGAWAFEPIATLSATSD